MRSAEHGVDRVRRTLAFGSGIHDFLAVVGAVAARVPTLAASETVVVDADLSVVELDSMKASEHRVQLRLSNRHQHEIGFKCERAARDRALGVVESQARNTLYAAFASERRRNRLPLNRHAF